MRVGIRCDAGGRTGVGHLIRCVALAEELAARDVAVHFLSDLGGLAWAEQQLAGRGLPRHPAPADPAGLVAAAGALDLDAVVLDSYLLSGAYGSALQAAGHTVLAVVDGDPLGQQADIYVDQNLDAEHHTPALPPGSVRLAGLPYALLRSAVRTLRPAVPPVADPGRTPRVVCFFGGTDAYRAAPVLAGLLIRTGAAFDAVVIGADDTLRADLHALTPAAHQRLQVLAPTDELPQLLADADLAVSASGTSTWELLCLGRPAALVWVVDNQIIGYGRAVERGLAAGAGHLPSLRDPASAEASAAVGVLRGLLTDASARTALAARAWAAVDGRGVARVADALITSVPTPQRPAPVCRTVGCPPAVTHDHTARPGGSPCLPC